MYVFFSGLTALPNKISLFLPMCNLAVSNASSKVIGAWIPGEWNRKQGLAIWASVQCLASGLFTMIFFYLTQTIAIIEISTLIIFFSFGTAFSIFKQGNRHSVPGPRYAHCQVPNLVTSTQNLSEVSACSAPYLPTHMLWMHACLCTSPHDSVYLSALLLTLPFHP